MSPYQHVPHPHIRHRKAARPVKVADQFSRTSPVARFNTAFALKITSAVGSMWCAYIFAAIALFGLPAAIRDGLGGIVQWIAQTFLQLVLLSIIIVGQNVQAAASDERAENTFQDAEAVLHEALQIQEHLLTQDRELERLIAALAPGGGPGPEQA
jgi:hypothetical protein